MQRARRAGAAAGGLLLALLCGEVALAQKPGGVLRLYHRDSPASLSIHEEATISTVMPMMGVFNNLVIYDPHVAQNSLQSIVPDLAESWSWSDDGTRLAFKLRRGVTWHDGKPFTARDVKCTWDLLTGKAKEPLRLNARATWYLNLADVIVEGDDVAIFQLKRSQPAFLALLASGFSPVYPCHVAPRDMRQHPVGTGPFKFVEFKPNQSIKLTRNPAYWKPGRPYLDGVEFTIIPNRSTAILAFVAGKLDMTFPYEVTTAMVKDLKSQLPDAMCQSGPLNVAPNMLINQVPPFDNPVLRRAMALTLDRQAFTEILGATPGDVGGAMLPPPEGVWGMPPEMLRSLPGFGLDVAKSRDEARALMRTLGYGPGKHLAVKIATRNLAIYRDPAAILIDQLKEIWIDGEIELVETASWLTKLVRGDFTIALSLVGNGVDEPDQQFYESYVCGSRNYIGYCNPALDRLVDQQSMEPDQDKRKHLVWEIDRQLQAAVVRPILYYMRAATCWRPAVKGITIMANSIYNGWRLEDVWLDR